MLKQAFLVFSLFTLPLQGMSFLKLISGYNQKYYDQKLLVAASEGKLIPMHKSILQGANILVQDKKGYSPLYVAATNGNQYIVASLINYLLQLNQRESAINMETNLHRTALHEAAKAGNLNIVQSLLAANADALIEDIQGKTALSEAYDCLTRTALRNVQNPTPANFARVSQILNFIVNPIQKSIAQLHPKFPLNDEIQKLEDQLNAEIQKFQDELDQDQLNAEIENRQKQLDNEIRDSFSEIFYNSRSLSVLDKYKFIVQLEKHVSQANLQE
ncbi:ankyrin repeat domain-containing protein [Candidatus Dependentiae bacterium]|nr:ankyrin repeat domain-containing protein [Candidatus Dependentiae bacterium]